MMNVLMFSFFTNEDPQNKSMHEIDQNKIVKVN